MADFLKVSFQVCQALATTAQVERLLFDPIISPHTEVPANFVAGRVGSCL